MSILSRLFGKKETPVVAEPQKKTRKHWRDRKCSGSGAKAMIPTGAGVVNGHQVGMCGVCGREGRPTKKGLVAGHLAKGSK